MSLAHLPVSPVTHTKVTVCYSGSFFGGGASHSYYCMCPADRGPYKGRIEPMAVMMMMPMMNDSMIHPSLCPRRNDFTGAYHT